MVHGSFRLAAVVTHTVVSAVSTGSTNNYTHKALVMCKLLCMCDGVAIQSVYVMNIYCSSLVLTNRLSLSVATQPFIHLLILKFGSFDRVKKKADQNAASY